MTRTSSPAAAAVVTGVMLNARERLHRSSRIGDVLVTVPPGNATTTDIAVNEPASFASIAAQAKASKPLATPRPVRAEKAARPAKTVKVREARA